MPVAVPKRDLAFTTADDWVFNRDIPAIGRSAARVGAFTARRVTLSRISTISYAVLNYYKIIANPASWLASINEMGGR